MESVIYTKNNKLLNHYVESYRKQISNLKQKIPNYESGLTYDEMNKLPLGISCIPTAIASIPVLAGSIGIGINVIGLFLAASADIPPSTIDTINVNAEKCIELVKNHLSLLAGSTILPGTIYAGMQARDAWGRKRKEKAQDMRDSLEQMLKCVSIIQRLKTQKYGECLFINNFLSNVDITRNEKSFNAELLESCYDYISNPDSEGFEQFFEFLVSSKNDKRTAKTFRESDYLKTLTSWYNKEYLERASLSYNKRALELKLNRQQTNKRSDKNV